MKRFCALFFVLFCLAAGSTVKFYGGGERKAEKVLLRGENFVIDGEKVPRERVREVVFSFKAVKEEQAAPPEQFDTQTLIAIADSMEEKYPDAAGLIMFDHGQFILRSDGTRLYRYHFAGKILKSSTLGWGTQTLFINEGRSTARVLFARTILPDGKVIYADTSKATIAPLAEDNVSFGYGKLYTLSIPGVQEGAIVEYLYETETYNPYDTALYFPSWYFQSEEPVYSSRVEIRLPKPKELYYILKNPPGAFGSLIYLGTSEMSQFCFVEGKKELEGFLPDHIVYADTSLGRWFESSLGAIKAAEPQIIDEDTARVWIWHMKNLPPLTPEDRMPDYGDVVPHLECSILPGWDYIFDWLGKLQRARMKPTPQIEAKVDELVGDVEGLEKKIDRIYRWVQREIQYISIKGSISSGQTGHPAGETFENGYGDCTDKSILLCTMLGVIGVEAHPIIIMTNTDETVDRCIPSLDGNHAITRVFMPDGRTLFLDPTDRASKFPYFRCDDQGVSFVDALAREVGMTSTNAPEDNLERFEIDVDLGADGSAKATFRSIPMGMREASYRAWWEWQQPERYEQIFANWMNSHFPRASLDSFALLGLSDLDSQLVEWASMSVDSFPTTAGDLWIITLPGIERAMLGFREVYLEKRRFDIEYFCPKQTEYFVRIKLPKGAKVVALPDDVELSCEPYADFLLEFNKRKGALEAHLRFRLKERIIPSYEFERYKQFILEAKQATQKRVFVRRPK